MKKRIRNIYWRVEGSNKIFDLKRKAIEHRTDVIESIRKRGQLMHVNHYPKVYKQRYKKTPYGRKKK